MIDEMHSESANDGVDRRGFMKCMAWAGTGSALDAIGGLPAARAFGQDVRTAAANDFSFVQISDSHIGFGKEPNKDVVGTLQDGRRQDQRAAATARLRSHTGDLTHLAKPEEFDTVAEVLKGRQGAGALRAGRTRFR